MGRNKLLTFCFAWFFGAGQMYLGYMKRGATIMGLFMGTIFLSATFGIGQLLIFLPIIYAYAFFDTFNVARFTPQEREQNPDTFLFNIDKTFSKINFDGIYEKRHKWVAWAFIIFGILMLYNNFISPVLWQIYRTYEMQWLARLIDGIPTFATAVALMGFGAHLLNSSRKKSSNDDIVEFSNKGSNK